MAVIHVRPNKFELDREGDSLVAATAWFGSNNAAAQANLALFFWQFLQYVFA